MMKKVLLGDIVNVIKGVSYRSVDYSQKGEGLAFINLKCVGRGGGFRKDGVKYYKGEYKPGQIVKPGDILIANTDLTQDRDIIGSPIFMPDLRENACFSLDLSKLEITQPKSIDKNYLFYYLKAPQARNYMISHSNGSTVMHLSVSSIPKMKLDLPDLATQKSNASFLNSIDEKIEVNRRMNETLEKIGQALFKHYFIDNPEAKTWETGKIGDIAEVTDYVANGSFASLKENVTLYDTPNYALYVRTTDYKGGFKNNLKYVDQKSYEFLKKTVLDGSEFIISNVGDVGTVFKAPVWFKLPMTLASNVVMVRNSKYNNYLYLYFRNSDGQFALSNIVAGSAQPKFNKTEFRNLAIRIPDVKYLDKFNVQYDLISNQIANLNSEIQTLTTLRDLLLPRLISGKIKV